MTHPRPNRRRLLAGLAGAAAAGLAGCVGGGEFEADDGDGGSDEPDGGETPDADEPGGTDTPDGDGGTDEDGSDNGNAADLDLREANVTGVAVEPADDGDADGDGGGDAYRFEVTLYHDDDGEQGYTNWWQVEAVPGGDRLGRRELVHAHGTRAFTRSATVTVPADADCVVVRGHDETHGYGGRAVLVSLPDGASAGRRQGSEPESFEPADCP